METAGQWHDNAYGPGCGKIGTDNTGQDAQRREQSPFAVLGKPAIRATSQPKKEHAALLWESRWKAYSHALSASGSTVRLSQNCLSDVLRSSVVRMSKRHH